MKQIRISYDVAGKIYKFLGETAPEPLDEMWHTLKPGVAISGGVFGGKIRYVGPAYQLHDLLDKPFTLAFSARIGKTRSYAIDLYKELAMEYFNSGLPAVEKRLCEIMGVKP